MGSISKDMTYVKTYYGVDADIGREVTCYGKVGVIVGSHGPHLAVQLDNSPADHPGYYHPTDGIVYGDMREPAVATDDGDE